MQLQGKSAIVTGAASGIGAEIARVFATAGAKVCVADIDGEAAKKTSSTLENAIAVRMDVTQESEVERGVDEAARRLGSVDILVSNAGVQHIDSLADASFQNWRKIISVHLDGGFLTTRACLRLTSWPSTACSASRAWWRRKGRRTASGPTRSVPGSCVRRWSSGRFLSPPRNSTFPKKRWCAM
jgi:NAD(P)-dependent dehydrogenase (short-subunit alcohol dehydrogenase family)